MKRLILVPLGWPCELRESPPGFFVYGGDLCFKTEYSKEDAGELKVEAYCSSGETFCRPNNIEVQPVEARWEDEEYY